VLAAFRDMENALGNPREYGAQATVLQQATDAANRTSDYFYQQGIGGTS
jgi:hypothetical protein